ncbi:hypothetical protein M0R72_12785 [Candidatus Pacearchaeota archaeon]|jgi:hypothetical protein|nr:hypothetical protein [Candidatus Pacearchaeota archaeon]
MYFVDDENFQQVLDIHAGITEGQFGLVPRDYDAQPLCSIPHTTPFCESFKLIDKKEWEDRAKAMQGRFIRNAYTGTPEEDSQGRMPYCWAFSLSQAVKGARDRANLPHVDLLAESLGGSVNWRNAGNYCSAAIQYAAEHGFCDRSFSPQRYNLNPRQWKEGWEQEALNHRVDEFWELGHIDMVKEVSTALLLGFGVYVGLNWLRHAMWFDELQFINGKLTIHTPNTWDVGQDMMLQGQKARPDEAYAIRTATWSNA